MRATESVTVALTGAPCDALVAGRARDLFTPLALAAGDLLEIGMPSGGVRTYVAVRGGIDCERVLGSRASDLLSRLGPEPLRDGDELMLGRADGDVPGIDVVHPKDGPDAAQLRPGQPVRFGLRPPLR